MSDVVGLVLNHAEIAELCAKSPPLIETFRTENIKGASYDLRLGRYARVGKKMFDLDEGDHTLCIPPYQVAYVETEESLNMPNFLVANFGLRMTWVFRGLIIPPQTQIDPGYNGRIFILFQNLSNAEVFIGRGDHIISIEFRRTTPTEALTSVRQGVMSLKDALRGVPPVESALSNLAKELHSYRQRVEVVLLVVLATAALFLAIVAITPLVKDFGVFKDSKPQQTVVEQSGKASATVNSAVTEASPESKAVSATGQGSGSQVGQNKQIPAK